MLPSGLPQFQRQCLCACLLGRAAAPKGGHGVRQGPPRSPGAGSVDLPGSGGGRDSGQCPIATARWQQCRRSWRLQGWSPSLHRTKGGRQGTRTAPALSLSALGAAAQRCLPPNPNPTKPPCPLPPQTHLSPEGLGARMERILPRETGHDPSPSLHLLTHRVGGKIQ